MSNYEDYQSTSKVYDNARRAVGLDFYLGALFRRVANGTGIEKLRVLDAGCGTGNYSRALLEAGVGHLTLYDGSSGMLDQARTKCAKWVEEGRCELSQGLLPQLPYKDNTFDAVMCNQVVHHLSKGTEEESGFPVLRELFSNMRRVLKPGGVVLLNYTTPHQNLSYWFMNLLPTSYKKLCQRQPKLSEMIELIRKTGLTLLEMDVPLCSTLIEPSVYHNYEAIFDDEFRKLDSTWALATEEEIQRAQEVVRTLDKKQIQQWEDYRLTNGQCTTVLAQRKD